VNSICLRPKLDASTFGSSLDELGILGRFRVAMDSKAYGIIEAIFAAIKNFSPQDKQKILKALAEQNPRKFLERFEEPLKEHSEKICSYLSEHTTHISADGAARNCVRDIEKALTIKFSTEEGEALRQELKNFFHNMFDEHSNKFFESKAREISDGFSKLESLKEDSAALRKLTNSLYGELLRTFFVPYPESDNSNLEWKNEEQRIVYASSFDTPARRDIISYDRKTGEFVAGSNEYAEFAEIATELLRRRDELPSSEAAALLRDRKLVF
jgi:hypothetical protein